MRIKTVVAGAVVVAAASVGTAGPAVASQHSERVYGHAQFLIDTQHIHVPWDGGYLTSHKHGFCIETFNGTDHDIKQNKGLVPPGFYLKFCADGNYYINDGVRFRGMRQY